MYCPVLDGFSFRQSNLATRLVPLIQESGIRSVKIRLFSVSLGDNSLGDIVRYRIVAVHGNGIGSKTLSH